jgi:hypothetical protein
MGLLDEWPDGWLGLLRNATQNPNRNGDMGIGAANYPQARQSPRLPLSFAGPDLAAGLPNWTQTQAPTASPIAAFPESPRTASSAPSAPYPPAAQPPAPNAQNLTAHALRTKGVPDADIAAAIGHPELMKQLINQNFGPGSNGTPSAPTDPITVRPENSKPPDEDAPTKLAQMFALPPVTLFARPPIYIPRQLTPLENLPKGSANGPRAGMDFLRNEGKPKSPDEYPPCTYCGEKTSPGNFHRDHIIPRSRGGDGAESNRVPACADCNIHKGARTPEEWYLWMENNRT